MAVKSAARYIYLVHVGAIAHLQEHRGLLNIKYPVEVSQYFKFALICVHERVYVVCGASFLCSME